MREYQLLLSSAAAWALAQMIKTLIDMMETKKLHAERLIGNGGMPSSHAATVSALATAAALKDGLASSTFAIAAVLSIVVIVDAMGVRLETGKQAKLLNQIVTQNRMILSLKDPQKRLKELVGHTPFQVLIGTMLGILTALLLNLIL